MNTLIVLIIFGLAVPVINVIANTLTGMSSEDVKEARSEYIEEHLIPATIGAIMLLAIPLVYWIYVIIQAM